MRLSYGNHQGDLIYTNCHLLKVFMKMGVPQ